jgi:hypothetical protein
LQRGSFDTGTDVWYDAVFNLVTIGSAVQGWVQLDKSTPLVNLTTNFTVQASSNFDETGTLTVFTISRTPVVSDFSASNPPLPAVASSTTTITFVNTVSQIITLPLADSRGKGTPLHGEMRMRYRSPHRFAVGFGWSGTGGAVLLQNFSLTYTEEFTGWGGHRGTAGVDRAVRCPRCGSVTKEADLVRDGYTLSDVCAHCFDPDPRAQPLLQWPFNG